MSEFQCSTSRFREPADRRERRSELVRGDRDELALHLDRTGELGAGVFECAFGPLPVADVAHDHRDFDDLGGVVADRRHCQRYVEQASVLRHSHGLEVAHRLAPQDGRQQLLHLFGAIIREQPVERPAEHLLGRVPEQGLRGRVPGCHAAVPRSGDDRVCRVLDDRRQPGLKLVRAVAIGDVVDEGVETPAGAVAARRIVSSTGNSCPLRCRAVISIRLSINGPEPISRKRRRPWSCEAR